MQRVKQNPIMHWNDLEPRHVRSRVPVLYLGNTTNEGYMKDKNVLVFDLGGGTFDVTLLNIDDGVFEALATSGDTHLGGEEFDQRVMQYFIKKIQKTAKVDISNDKRALQKLRKETERVKRALSTQQQSRLEIDDLVSGYDLSDTLTRARFEEINLDLFQKTLGSVREVLNIAKVSKADIDHIVLGGKSTRIPRSSNCFLHSSTVKIFPNQLIQMREFLTVLPFKEAC